MYAFRLNDHCCNAHVNIFYANMRSIDSIYYIIIIFESSTIQIPSSPEDFRYGKCSRCSWIVRRNFLLKHPIHRKLQHVVFFYSIGRLIIFTNKKEPILNAQNGTRSFFDVNDLTDLKVVLSKVDHWPVSYCVRKTKQYWI